jgi:hypothetical protein
MVLMTQNRHHLLANPSPPIERSRLKHMLPRADGARLL